MIMSNRRDPRWSKQFGDFGEQLVMYLIGRTKKYESCVSRSCWCRFVASDLGNKENRYAISVKSHTLNIKISENDVNVESKLYNFDEHNIKQLKSFAENFALKPVVSIVIVQPEIPQDHPCWKAKLEKNKNN